IRPKERPYQTENFYAVLERQRNLEKEVSAIVKGTNQNGAGRGSRKA
ncbi:MAG: PrgI family protein, partial [Oscillospiraceae bacterium]|nr:PrgI family protein [Oscillospiraceae bacterium]